MLYEKYKFYHIDTWIAGLTRLSQLSEIRVAVSLLVSCFFTIETRTIFRCFLGFSSFVPFLVLNHGPLRAHSVSLIDHVSIQCFNKFEAFKNELLLYLIYLMIHLICIISIKDLLKTRDDGSHYDFRHIFISQ